MGSTKAELSAKLSTIQTVPGIQAIAPDQSGATTAKLAVVPADAQNDASYFEEAGWTFIELIRPGDSQCENVVMDGDGHLKIATPNLNVKFDPQMSPTEIESLIEDFGLSVRRKMGFAANSFLVASSTSNAVSTAQSLMKRDDVVYAEPVLIEAIKGR